MKFLKLLLISILFKFSFAADSQKAYSEVLQQIKTLLLAFNQADEQKNINEIEAIKLNLKNIFNNRDFILSALNEALSINTRTKCTKLIEYLLTLVNFKLMAPCYFINCIQFCPELYLSFADHCNFSPCIVSDYFFIACKYLRHEIIIFLLNRDISIDLNDKHRGFDGLMMAMNAGDEYLIKILLNAGAVINANNGFSTPFYDYSGHFTIIDETYGRFTLNISEENRAKAKKVYDEFKKEQKEKNIKIVRSSIKQKILEATNTPEDLAALISQYCI